MKNENFEAVCEKYFQNFEAACEKYFQNFEVICEGDSGWQDTKSLKNSKLPVCVSKGYLLSQAKGITRIFTDFIETKDKPTFDNIGNTTIIPTSVIVSIKKINL